MDWDFLFKAMKEFGICDNYTRVSKLLFTNARAIVNIYDQPTKQFPIQRGLRHAP